MPIDFSAYAPTTVLRVRCLDDKEAVVFVGMDSDDIPHRLIRFDRIEKWLHDTGRVYDSDLVDTQYDVTEIIGEMVLATNKEPEC